MIDVVISSTCRMELRRCLESFMNRVNCSEGFNFLVNIDVRKEARLANVMGVLERYGIVDVWINRSPLPAPNGHVDAVNLLYGEVRSRYYFSLEDDWVFLRDVNLDDYIFLMDKNNYIDHIRFSKEKIKGYSWLYHKIDTDIQEYRRKNIDVKIEDKFLVKAHTLSFNPSLNRTDVIQQFLPIPHGVNPEKYICSMYDQCSNAGGAYIAGQIGDPPLVRDIGRNPIREGWRKAKEKVKFMFQTQEPL